MPDWLLGTWDAFWTLARSRPLIPVAVPLPTGGAATVIRPGPIDYGHIDIYARRHGFDGEAFVALERLVLAMDAVWLAVTAEQAREG